MKVHILVLCLIAFLCVLSAEGKKKYAKARGRVLCHITGGSRRVAPVPYVKVKLMDKDPGFDDTFGTTRTNCNGYFTVSGWAGDLFGNPDPYILVEYQYSGHYGKMEVENAIGINRKHKTPVKPYSPYLHFGSILLKEEDCNAYFNTLAAMKNYRHRTRQSLPYKKLRVVTRAPLHAGTPFSTTNKIQIPKGFTLNYRTAQHEFAHTLRHSLDGSLRHFLWDVFRFRYMQHHHCRKVTNKGFAFNEGWAEFWAGECLNQTGTNYRIEGNVASALLRLKRRCNSSDGKMVHVLRRNRGRIHSYREFARAHRRMYGCS